MTASFANQRWFCHFDDDNYVNVPRLVRFLGDYNPRDDWYLGKPSIQAPLEIMKKEKKVLVSVDKAEKEKVLYHAIGECPNHNTNHQTSASCSKGSIRIKQLFIARSNELLAGNEKQKQNPTTFCCVWVIKME
nr:unnamed protein product [Callosobruchus analis]